MPLPAYDIFKRRDVKTLVWIEAAPDLSTADVRINELQKASREVYVVSDQRTRQTVVIIRPS
jgi:hypothetical protein